MASDLPDYTTWAQIKGVDVTVNINIESTALTLPVDITAATATVGVDITAQTVGDININLAASDITLNVNLSSQTADIDINLAAADITLNVDINAQSIGNLTIDIEAQSVGVFLEPEWQSKAGNWKQFGGMSVGLASGSSTDWDYTVPAGKTFYISVFAASAYAHNAADQQKLHTFNATLRSPTGTVKLRAGADIGFITPFSPPLKIAAGVTVRVRIYNYCGHSITHSTSVAGYEV